jgi:hypothetical protein
MKKTTIAWYLTGIHHSYRSDNEVPSIIFAVIDPYPGPGALRLLAGKMFRQCLTPGKSASDARMCSPHEDLKKSHDSLA